MDFLANIYQKTIAENDKNIRFWEEYIQNLRTIDFSAFSDKLKVPVLVPVGSKVLFRGELKHTNEVTVALGADYFTKCSLQQAEVLRQHRIKDAESKLQAFRKEREYIDNQLTFSKQNIFAQQGHEILEEHTEEEDRAWREAHRERMRQWKQKGEDKTEDNRTDEELWERLEELELQEELENELMRDDGQVTDNRTQYDSFIVKEETIFKKTDNQTEKKSVNFDEPETKAVQNKKVNFVKQEPSKLDLLQKVLDKQNELEEKLTELRNKERGRSKTEEDLIAKLDEMEELDELQDEMDRLEDIIETEDIDSDDFEEDSQSKPVELKRSVSFADEDEDETLELTFHHSDVEPCKESYDPERGITKPSDIYEAYPNSFKETTSILKKTSKYVNKEDIEMPVADNKKKEEWVPEVTGSITVKDVIEKISADDNKVQNNEKRTSLFKQRRQQKKLGL